jgi:hypothetical protein
MCSTESFEHLDIWMEDVKLCECRLPPVGLCCSSKRVRATQIQSQVLTWYAALLRSHVSTVCGLPQMLVGNKVDLAKSRTVDYKRAVAYADKHGECSRFDPVAHLLWFARTGMQYIETSASANINIEKCFQNLTLAAAAIKIKESDAIKAREQQQRKAAGAGAGAGPSSRAGPSSKPITVGADVATADSGCGC